MPNILTKCPPERAVAVSPDFTEWTLLEEGTRKRKRYEKWHPLTVSPYVVRGLYEYLSDDELQDVLARLRAEADRRGGVDWGTGIE